MDLSFSLLIRQNGDSKDVNLEMRFDIKNGLFICECKEEELSYEYNLKRAAA